MRSERLVFFLPVFANVLDRIWKDMNDENFPRMQKYFQIEIFGTKIKDLKCLNDSIHLLNRYHKVFRYEVHCSHLRSPRVSIDC